MKYALKTSCCKEMQWSWTNHDKTVRNNTDIYHIVSAVNNQIIGKKGAYMYREKSLDTFKGIALIGVLSIHAGAANLPGILGKFGNAGTRGVQIFFIISAYLMMLSLDKIKNLSNKKEIVNWYIAKFIRLIPLYWIYIFIYLFINGQTTTYWCGSLKNISWINILMNLFFLNGLSPWYINTFSVNWYLGDLAIFIIIAPLIYKYIIKAKEKSILVGVIIMIVSTFACNYMIDLSQASKDSYVLEAFWNSFSFIAEFPVMLMGVFIFQLKKSCVWSGLEGKRGISYALLLFGSFLLIYGLIIRNEYLGMRACTIYGLVFTIIIVSQLIYSNKFYNNNKVIQWLGRHSYGIYLSHWLILQAIKNINSTIDPVSNFLINFLVTIICSSVLTIIGENIIEKPFVKFVAKKYGVKNM